MPDLAQERPDGVDDFRTRQRALPRRLAHGGALTGALTGTTTTITTTTTSRTKSQETHEDGSTQLCEVLQQAVVPGRITLRCFTTCSFDVLSWSVASLQKLARMATVNNHLRLYFQSTNTRRQNPEPQIFRNLNREPRTKLNPRSSKAQSVKSESPEP